MDFGARLCIPKNPDCGLCPLKSTCFAFQKGLVKELPVKINKTKVKERNLHYFVIQCGQDYVWNKRKAGDIWEGLHDFPMEEKGNEKSTKLDFPTDQKPAAFLKKYRHILSHQKLNASFSKLDIPIEKYPELAQWCENEGYFLVAENEIAYLPKPKLIVNFFERSRDLSNFMTFNFST